MPEGLNLIVGADVTEAEAALKKFVTTAEQSATAASAGVTKGLAPATQAIAKIPAAAKTAIAGVSKLGDSIETLRAKLLAKKDFLITEKDLAKIAIYNKEIRSLEIEILRVQNAGREGFDDIGNAVVKSNGALSGFSKGAQKGFSAVRQLAYILPGIGIAGIFGLAAEGVEKLITSLVSLGNSFDPVKELGSAISGASKNFVDASTAVSTLKEEISLAKQGFIDKDKVVQAYNETLGKTTGFVKTLDEAEAALNKNAEAYIRFTLLKAAANIALEKAAEKAFEAEQARQKALQAFNTIGSRASGGITGQSSAPGLVPTDLNAQFLARQNAAEKAKEKLIKTAEDEKTGLVNIGNDLLKQAAEISKQFGFNFFGNNEIKKGSDKVSHLLEDTIATAKRLAAYLDSHRIRSFVFDVDPSETLKQTYEKAVKFIEAASNRPRSFLLKQTFFQLPPTAFGKTEKAFDKFATEVPKLTKDLTDLIQDQFNRHPILVQFRKMVTDNNTRELERANLTGQSIPGLNAPVSLLSDVEKQSINTANAIRDVLTPAFQDLFGAILKGESPIKAFLQGIGQAITQLIQKLIAAAIQAAILSALFPGGLGTVKGFGGFFKNITGFAAGGIVSGPTLALVGEGRGTSRSNPEVIAPLDQLRGMLEGMGGSGSQVIVLSPRLRGQDITYSQARTSRRNGRLGG